MYSISVELQGRGDSIVHFIAYALHCSTKGHVLIGCSTSAESEGQSVHFNLNNHAECQRACDHFGANTIIALLEAARRDRIASPMRAERDVSVSLLEYKCQGRSSSSTNVYQAVEAIIRAEKHVQEGFEVGCAVEDDAEDDGAFDDMPALESADNLVYES
ncbi:hypothetical protein PENSPDRAFT_670088 [Peniophora sp. CONT]|nr:hypothetical protein PENSPDRAFT_670088 [Peniophora sp. CONT]